MTEDQSFPLDPLPPMAKPGAFVKGQPPPQAKARAWTHTNSLPKLSGYEVRDCPLCNQWHSFTYAVGAAPGQVFGRYGGPGFMVMGTFAVCPTTGVAMELVER